MQTIDTTAIDIAREQAREMLATGRRFEDADMTPALTDAAAAYARQYSGTFGFMQEMRAKALGRGLSQSQGRGVMNCVLAEQRNAQPAETVEFAKIAAMLAAARTHLKYPKIRLAADGQSIVVSLAGDRSKEPGSVVVTGAARSYLGRISTDGTFRGSPGATVLATLKAFAADPETVAREYGRLTGQCCFCGLNLQDERSTAVGYGPICAKHFGLAWGTAAAA